jgi:T4-like virus tail tube protein gp19
MATRSTNPHRFDPYKNFKFRVKIDGRPVAGVARVSGLTARKLPGVRKYPNLTLKRGMTRDAKFQKWATAMSDSRKDVVIEIYDETGKLERAYRVYRGWVFKYQSSDLNASANEVGIESLTLHNEGIEVIAGGRRRARARQV